MEPIMDPPNKLSPLEFYMLTSQADGPEPLFVLYYESLEDSKVLANLKGLTLDKMLETLVKLVKGGYSECDVRPPVNGVYDCPDITVAQLKKRFKGLSPAEMREYPPGREYYFGLTKKGKEENLKDIYDEYFPEWHSSD